MTSNLLKEIKVINLVDAQTAAASDYTSSPVVDTAGYDGCIFVAKLGTSAVNNGLKVQQDTASGFGGGADLASSKKLLDATAKVAIVSIHRPLERYLKPIVIRGTSSTIDSVVAILYGPRTKVQADDASANSKQLVSPSEGTA